jgi:hypothetical protein
MTMNQTRASISARRALLAAVALTVVAGSSGAQEKAIRFRVVNATTDEVRAIHVCPTSASKWGPNLLAEPAPASEGTSAAAPVVRPLARGGRIDLALNGECGLYDVRLVLPEGREYMEEELSFCEDDEVITIGGGTLRKTSAEAEK